MVEKHWYKSRGYLHLTPQVSQKDAERMVQNPAYVARHAFLPLIKRTKIVRRYKEVNGKRVHSYWKDGIKEKTQKKRPIEYATHIDAHIFAYYAKEKLQPAYEKEVKSIGDLSNCICAYRELPTAEGKGNKSNIHVAHEVFEHIKQRGECVAMAFDIEKFFPSLNHAYLKKAWENLMQKDRLSDDEYAVFKAATKYSHIDFDQLRLCRNRGLDERSIALLRNKGIHAFYENAKAFAQVLKEGKFKVNRNIEKGIPHGLPISAHFANLYLLEFDKIIYEIAVKKYGAMYRRYSDDIIIVCKTEDYEILKKLVVETIEICKLKISKEKTEVCHFKYDENGILKVSREQEKGILKANMPLIYLGFEFYGHKTLIKSTNLAKLYRKAKDAIRRKKRRIEKGVENGTIQDDTFWKRKIIRQFTALGKKKHKVEVKATIMKYNPKTGLSKQVKVPRTRKKHGNFFTYAYRAADEIMNEPAIRKQLRKNVKIVKKAIQEAIAIVVE